MVLKRFAFIALFTSTLGIVSGSATAQDTAGPANPPPDDFEGREFVDINGCVFVRGGVNGAVTWVPRVSRSREQVCGQTPTFAVAEEAGGAATATESAPAPAPVVAAPVNGNGNGNGAAAPAPDVAVAPVVVPPDATAEDVRQIRAAAAVVDGAAPPPAPRAVPRLVRPVPEHSGAMMQDHGAQIVMMEPAAPRHARKPIRVMQPAAPSKPGGFRPPGRLQIVPKHVWEQQDRSVMHVPAGYKPAWEDDRLNPFRAWQTVKGYYDTQEIWTNTVPRRLVKIAGAQRTKNPVLVGHVTPRSRPMQHSGQIVQIHGGHGQGEGVFVSTRQEPARRAAPGKPRFVEIGVFTTEAKARAAAGRLSAQGLSVRIGTVRRGGETLRRVKAGPYSEGAPIEAAMRKARAAGYLQAYLR
ncbi:SPOR domain-containing protein [Cognatishimia sp. F0-27]|uniref:SPOR domain-containing protein n=1 Tax=Cognatishimia sp. F0-27 TaxID=2816855 RepID=UPI001D0C00F3|nr:SPOR domain-containing protein [Cognatishimia sp. F0-27]MCC1493991.1 SPOR domain-containing protein [Cognatishimia sp. F0-27]